MTNDMKRDRKRCARRLSRWSAMPISTEADYARREALYRMLYLDKYTPLTRITPLAISARCTVAAY